MNNNIFLLVACTLLINNSFQNTLAQSTLLNIKSNCSSIDGICCKEGKVYNLDNNTFIDDSVYMCKVNSNCKVTSIDYFPLIEHYYSIRRLKFSYFIEKCHGNEGDERDEGDERNERDVVKDYMNYLENKLTLNIEGIRLYCNYTTNKFTFYPIEFEYYKTFYDNLLKCSEGEGEGEGGQIGEDLINKDIIDVYSMIENRAKDCKKYIELSNRTFTESVYYTILPILLSVYSIIYKLYAKLSKSSTRLINVSISLFIMLLIYTILKIFIASFI